MQYLDHHLGAAPEDNLADGADWSFLLQVCKGTDSRARRDDLL